MADHTERKVKVVRAAGGVVTRTNRKGKLEVLLIHRPGHDDWSLPKGKLDRGERHRDAAVREVHEETGIRCALGDELATVEYDLPSGKRKRVRYWVMHPVKGAIADREPDDEVDEVRWVKLNRAKRMVSYRHDHELLEEITP